MEFGITQAVALTNHSPAVCTYWALSVGRKWENLKQLWPNREWVANANRMVLWVTEVKASSSCHSVSVSSAFAVGSVLYEILSFSLYQPYSASSYSRAVIGESDRPCHSKPHDWHVHTIKDRFGFLHLVKIKMVEINIFTNATVQRIFSCCGDFPLFYSKMH